MSKLPSAEDLGQVAVPEARPVASINAEPLAVGAERLGAGIQRVGQGIGEAVEQGIRGQELLAQDTALGKALQLRQAYRHDTDYATLPQRYQADLDNLLNDTVANSGIPAGPDRDRLRAKLQVPLAREMDSVQEQSFQLQRGTVRAQLAADADDLTNTTGAYPDPLHNAKVQQFGERLHLARDQGFYTPMETETLARNFARGVEDARYRARLRASPEEAMQALHELNQAQVGERGVASVIARAETGDPTLGHRAISNISSDTNGSKSYGFLGLNSGTGSAAAFARRYGTELGLTARPGSVEFDRQWKAAADSHPDDFRAAQLDYFNTTIVPGIAGDLEGNGVPEAVANDPRVKTYFADRAVQMGTIGLHNAAPAWQRAGGDVPTFLKNMNTIDAAPSNLQANFHSALASGVYSAKGHATRLATRLNGALTVGADDTELPGGGPGVGAKAPWGATDILTPTRRDALMREGGAILRAYEADQRRAQADEDKARKAQAEQNEFNIFADLHSGAPKITMQNIVDMTNSGLLTPEGGKRSIELFDKMGRDESLQDKRHYGAGYDGLFNRIYPSEPNAPDRIGSYDQLMSAAVPMLHQPGGLTVAGLDRLQKDLKSDDGEQRKNALDYARATLTGHNDALGIKDPKGLMLYGQALPLIDKAIERLRADGKPVSDLSNEKSPYFVGNIIAPLKRKPAEIMADMNEALGVGAAEPPAPAQHWWTGMFGGGKAPVGAPQVGRFTPPSGWQFSPSRQQYRDPRTGQIYDASGRPVASASPTSEKSGGP